MKLIQSITLAVFCWLSASCNPSRSWKLTAVMGLISFLLSVVVIILQKKNMIQAGELAKIEQEKIEKELALERAERIQIEKQLILEKTEREKEEAEQKVETLQNMYQKRNNEIQVAFLEKLKFIKDMILLNPKQSSPIMFAKEMDTILSKFTMQKYVDITNEL
jgi:hypothetical protein